MEADALDADMRIFIPRSSGTGAHPPVINGEDMMTSGEERLLLWLPAKAQRAILG